VSKSKHYFILNDRENQKKPSNCCAKMYTSKVSQVFLKLDQPSNPSKNWISGSLVEPVDH